MKCTWRGWWLLHVSLYLVTVYETGCHRNWLGPLLTRKTEILGGKQTYFFHTNTRFHHWSILYLVYSSIVWENDRYLWPLRHLIRVMRTFWPFKKKKTNASTDQLKRLIWKTCLKANLIRVIICYRTNKKTMKKTWGMTKKSRLQS